MAKACTTILKGANLSQSWQPESWNSFAGNNRGKLQCPDVQAWLSPLHTESALWLQPKVQLLNTDSKEVNAYAINYFMLHVFICYYFVKICFPFDIRVLVFCKKAKFSTNRVENPRGWILFIGTVKFSVIIRKTYHKHRGGSHHRPLQQH